MFLKHIRAGLAYQLVLLAGRIHPPLFAELADTAIRNITPTPRGNDGG